MFTLCEGQLRKEHGYNRKFSNFTGKGITHDYMDNPPSV